MCVLSLTLMIWLSMKMTMTLFSVTEVWWIMNNLSKLELPHVGEICKTEWMSIGTHSNESHESLSRERTHMTWLLCLCLNGTAVGGRHHVNYTRHSSAISLLTTAHIHIIRSVFVCLVLFHHRFLVSEAFSNMHLVPIHMVWGWCCKFAEGEWNW